MFEKKLREAGKQDILQKNVPKILDLKSSSEQIFSENWRCVPLIKASIDQNLLLFIPCDTTSWFIIVLWVEC